MSSLGTVALLALHDEEEEVEAVAVRVACGLARWGEEPDMLLRTARKMRESMSALCFAGESSVAKLVSAQEPSCGLVTVVAGSCWAGESTAASRLIFSNSASINNGVASC